MVINTTGVTRWTADHLPFGETVSEEHSENDPGLRYPGQWTVPEAEGLGLPEMYYNLYRWYVPGWGRYSQSDPIGLRGGVNLFGYANGNSLRFVDPLGLRPCCKEEIDGDLSRFRSAYNKWFLDPQLGLGQQDGANHWGPIGNAIYICTLGNRGSSCTAWAVGLLNALQPLNTECCRAIEHQRWVPPHTNVKIECRSNTDREDWSARTTFDPFYRIRRVPVLYPGPGLMPVPFPPV